MEFEGTLLRSQMEKYMNEHETYKRYADFLRDVLGRACRRIAPFSLVEARAKSTASHAAKVISKQARFRDPEYRITDLCGARVITQTSREKELVCDYIRRNFDIDERNSIDVRTRLKEDEFGYLSVHYIVQVKETDSELEGVRVPDAIARGSAGHKAEIQVRTLLEHAWANIIHDRIYKARIQIPAALRRDAAALAATMEEADKGFSQLAQTVDSYLGNYSASLSKERIAEEREMLEMLGAAPAMEGDEREKADISLRLGRLVWLSGNLEAAIAELERYVERETPSQDAIRAELGRALCRFHKGRSESPEFLRGQMLLRMVAEREPGPRETVLPSEKTLRAGAAHALAWSHSQRRDNELEARKWYRRAFELDPGNPYHLASFIEYEVFCRRDRSFVDVMRPLIEQAVATCRSHLAVCIEVPRACFTIARLYLLAGEPAFAFNAYAKGVGVVLAPDSAAAEDAIDDEIAFLHHINVAKTMPAVDNRIERLLLLAKALKNSGSQRSLPLESLRSEGAEYVACAGRETVLMIVGGASKMDEKSAREYADVIEKALAESDGLVCSGATTSGIPGLVGETAAALAGEGRKRFVLMGYIPHHLPYDARADRERYDRIIVTEGDTFTELEPLQNWIDITHAGIRPKQVRILGVNGGEIAAFEYRLALALGAKVGIVLYSGREADAILNDPYWHDHPNLVRLQRGILDAATVRAFVRPSRFVIEPQKLEELAEIIHEKYISESPYSDIDPSRRKYRDLRVDFKESNRQQVLYVAEILGAVGYTVVPFTGKGDPPMPEFTPEDIERMAELEHGRWNIERLSAGWQYGRRKDPERKLNPCLVSWKDLPDGKNGVKRYDRDAVMNFAKVLAKAGYRIVKA